MSQQLCSCPNNASYCIVPSMGTVTGLYNQPFNLVLYMCNNTTNTYTANIQLLDASGNVNCQVSNVTVLPGDNTYSLTGCRLTSPPGVTQTWTIQMTMQNITITQTINVHAINQTVEFFLPYQMCCIYPNKSFTVQDICSTPAGGSCNTTQISLGQTYMLQAPAGVPPLFTFIAYGVASNETLTATVEYYFQNGTVYVVTKQFKTTTNITIDDVYKQYVTNGGVSYVSFKVTSSLGSLSVAEVVYAAYTPCACGTPTRVSVPYEISVVLNDNAVQLAQVYATLTNLQGTLLATSQITSVQGAIPPAYVTGSFNMLAVQPLSMGIIPAILNVYASNYNTPDASTFIALGIQSGTGLGSVAIAANCGSYTFCPCTISVAITNLTQSGITGYAVAYYGTNGKAQSDTVTIQPGQTQTVTLQINVSSTTPVTIDFIDANSGNVLATTQCTVTVTGLTPIINEIIGLAVFAVMMSLIGALINMIRRRRRE